MPLNTPSSWLDHNALKIIKGIGATPTDNNSAESPLVVVNLLSGIITLDTNGWSPQIATLKSDGVWADSPITDGRTLIAAPSSNVIEKMTVIIADKSYLSVIQALSGLNQMVTDCRNFWQSGYQIDPVYLTWFASCGRGEQYALLYNINVSPEYLDSPMPSMRVALTLEREPYWRGIPPGANPKLWTFYVRNQQIGLAGKVLADATLISGSDHLITQTIQNKFEWTTTAFGLQQTPISQNYVAITVDQVPGDAPALMEVTISPDTALPNGYAIGKTSKQLTKIGHDGLTHNVALNLNVGDYASGALVKTAGTNVQGVRSNGSNTLFYRGVRSTAGIDANYVTAAQWGANAANGILLDRELYRGTYAIFLRAFASNLGADTDHKARITIEEYEDNGNENIASQVLPEFFVTQANGPLMFYAGTVTIPFSNRSLSAFSGYGLQIQETISNLRVTLEHKCLVAGARTVNMIDIFFVPIDEGMLQTINISNTGSFPGVGPEVIYDNTGYLTRDAKSGSYGYVTNQISGGATYEIRGTDIYLSPRTNQRIYFAALPVTPSQSFLQETYVIRMNIVPRWSGIRDT